MKNTNQHVAKVQWWARSITIVYAAFISIFSMDVFSEGYGVMNTAVALFMHLLPTFLILLILILAWRREWIGGVAFLILGVFYVYYSSGKIDWTGIAMIGIPLFFLSILYFVGWFQRKRKPASK